MTTGTRTRKPRGVPVGGQFATEPRAEATGVALAPDPAATVFTTRYDTITEKVAAFTGELEKRVADLADDENWNAYLVTMAKFHRYSMYNQLLIQEQRPDATHVAGYRKWEDLGRHVNAGERGIAILAPKIIHIDELDKNRKPLKDAKGRHIRRRVCVGFTTATVFDVSQTDGAPLPQIDRDLSEEPPDGFQADLETAIADAGYTVAYEPIGGEAGGHTSPVDKRVVVNSALRPANTVEVLAHELGHIKATPST